MSAPVAPETESSQHTEGPRQLFSLPVKRSSAVDADPGSSRTGRRHCESVLFY